VGAGFMRNFSICGPRIHTDKQPGKTKYCQHDQREEIGCLVSVAGQRLGAGKYQKSLTEERVTRTQMQVTNGGPANQLEDNHFVHPYMPVQFDSIHIVRAYEDHTTTDQLHLGTAMWRY
jgi:hypothetical protein